MFTIIFIQGNRLGIAGADEVLAVGGYVVRVRGAGGIARVTGGGKGSGTEKRGYLTGFATTGNGICNSLALSVQGTNSCSRPLPMTIHIYRNKRGVFLHLKGSCAVRR